MDVGAMVVVAEGGTSPISTASLASLSAASAARPNAPSATITRASNAANSLVRALRVLGLSVWGEAFTGKSSTRQPYELAVEQWLQHGCDGVEV
jgi:hypothetical protein